MPETGKKIIDERNDVYGEAWSLHGIMLSACSSRLMDLLITQPKYFFAWNLIFNKLIRALATPLDEDHWIDIQGYAELVLQDIRRGKHGS